MLNASQKKSNYLQCLSAYKRWFLLQTPNKIKLSNVNDIFWCKLFTQFIQCFPCFFWVMQDECESEKNQVIICSADTLKSAKCLSQMSNRLSSVKKKSNSIWLPLKWRFLWCFWSVIGNLVLYFSRPTTWNINAQNPVPTVSWGRIMARLSLDDPAHHLAPRRPPIPVQHRRGNTVWVIPLTGRLTWCR